MQPQQNYDFLIKTEVNHIPGKTELLLHLLKKHWLAIVLSMMAIQLPFYGYELLKVSQHTSMEEIQGKKAAQIKMVQKITPEEMTHILKFIQKTQNMETARLNETFWKIKYIESQQPEKYSLLKATRQMSLLHAEMKKHYEYRVSELSLAYKLVMAGSTNILEPTYDSQDALRLLLIWHSIASSEQIITFNSINKFISEWEEDFTDKAGIKKYMDSNKELINSMQVFTVTK